MKVHFIGIGGISMSGLANICLNLDYIVSGSDSQENFFTTELASKGATIWTIFSKYQTWYWSCRIYGSDSSGQSWVVGSKETKS